MDEFADDGFACKAASGWENFYELNSGSTKSFEMPVNLEELQTK